MGESLVVGQAGGATAVTNASLVGVVDAADECGRFGRVLGMRHGLDGLITGDFVDLGALSRSQRDCLHNTPSAALGTARRKLTGDDAERCLAALSRAGARAIILIGGNDSADSALQLSRLASSSGMTLSVLLVPKTVDNDLVETDFSPGYPSLARFLGTVVRDAIYDSLAAPLLYPVKVIEVGGRDAGWAVASASAGFPIPEAELLPLLYFPERPVASADQIAAEIEARVCERGFAVAVLPETLREATGRPIGGDRPDEIDGFGHPYFPSPAEAIARLVSQQTGLRARWERPGSGARMSVMLGSIVDRDLAYRAGWQAATRACERETDAMVSFVRGVEMGRASWQLVSTPLATIANAVRLLPDEFIGDDGRSTTKAFRSYLEPLLGPAPFPEYCRL